MMNSDYEELDFDDTTSDIDCYEEYCNNLDMDDYDLYLDEDSDDVLHDVDSFLSGINDY